MDLDHITTVHTSNAAVATTFHNVTVGADSERSVMVIVADLDKVLAVEQEVDSDMALDMDMAEDLDTVQVSVMAQATVVAVGSDMAMVVAMEALSIKQDMEVRASDQ